MVEASGCTWVRTLGKAAAPAIVSERGKRRWLFRETARRADRHRS
jgi:hypothetical protein